jgi:hypothetical protein
MDLTLRGRYSIKFCMMLIAVKSHDNYYSQFFSPFFELVQEKALSIDQAIVPYSK